MIVAQNKNRGQKQMDTAFFFAVCVRVCYDVRMARYRGNIKSRYEHREDLE